MDEYSDFPSTSDDFYTYGSPEPLTLGEIDGYDDSQGPWDYDPFGPDADIWQSISE